MKEVNQIISKLGILKNNKLFSIFLIALILRLIPVLAFRDIGISLDDMYQYDMLARSIVAGNGYRWYAQEDLNLVEQYINLEFISSEYDSRGVLTSFRPPLYPLFLASIYYVFGVGTYRYFYARIIQAIIGAILAPLIYLIAARIFPGNKKIPLISSIIIAIYPMLVVYPLSLATENLFFILLLISLLLLLIAIDKEKWQLFLLCGIVLGLLSLTRSVALGFSGLVFLWMFFILRRKKKAFILLVGLIITISPWIIRNSLLHGKLMGIESALGYDLYVGYHPQGTGTFQYGISLDLMSIMDDGLRDQIGIEKAVKFITSDPSRDLYLIVRKMGYFMGLEKRALIYLYTNNYFGYIPTFLMGVLLVIFLSPFVLIAISGVLGFYYIKWNHQNLILILLLFGYAVPHFLILAEPRFHLSLVPVFAIGAAYFWEKGYKILLNQFSTKKFNWKFGLSIFTISLLIANWIFEIIRDHQVLVNLLSIGGNIKYLPY